MSSDPIASRRFRRIRHRRAVAYRAGPGLDDALAVCRRLATYGLASTIGYSASRGESAREVAGVHMGAFEALAADGLDAYVSVKLPALDFDARLFAELASAAAQSGRRLHLDALAPSTADVTWLLLEGAPRTDVLGTTLPARWRRSADDASRAVDLGLAVRVVKGQWADGDATVDADEGFLEVVDRLSGHAAGVAVATHAADLLAESLRRLRRGTRRARRSSSTACRSALRHLSRDGWASACGSMWRMGMWALPTASPT